MGTIKKLYQDQLVGGSGSAGQEVYPVTSTLGVYDDQNNQLQGVLDKVTTNLGLFTCGTAAATAAKTVSASKFVLMEGGSVKIKFTYANSADSPTLAIGSTAAKPIMFNGSAASASNSWGAGEIVEFFYDGTNWVGNSTSVSVSQNTLTTENKAKAISVGGTDYNVTDADAQEKISQLSQKNPITLDYMSEILPAGISAYQIWLHTSTGNLLMRNSSNDGNIEIEKTDGMLVTFNGVQLVYNETNAKWYPVVPKSWECPLLPCPKFVRWGNAIGTNVIAPAYINSEIHSSLRIPVHKGDTIVAIGYGSTTTPLLAITDKSLNILYKKSTWDVIAPTCIVSEWDGYVFYNSFDEKDGLAVEQKLYVSSYNNKLDILGLFDALPTLYNVPFNISDIYYRDGTGDVSETDMFVMQLGQSRQNITDGLKELDLIYFDGKNEYQYVNEHLVEIGQKPTLKYSITDNLKNVAADIAGITFTAAGFYDDIHGKLSQLVAAHPDVLTKIDAVTFVNNNGYSLSYPEYCNLNGQASGNYMATPTYRTYLYKLSQPNNEGLKQRTYFKKYKVFVTGGVHGYEIAAPTDIYLFAKNILDGAVNDPNLYLMRSNVEFYFVPCVNGYGIYHGDTGIYSRTNANGVNINRNFPTGYWEQTEPGMNYSGPSAGSEFETKLIMALVNSIQPDVCIDHHNFDEDNNIQFWMTNIRSNVLNASVLYKTLLDLFYAIKKNKPAYFGGDFGYIGQNPLTLEATGGATAASWFYNNYGCKLSTTFEVSRCINFINGGFDGQRHDDYGPDLFSINEYGLRTLIERMTEQIKQINP